MIATVETRNPLPGRLTRTLVYGALLILLPSILVACGDNEEDAGEETDTATTPATSMGGAMMAESPTTAMMNDMATPTAGMMGNATATGDASSMMGGTMGSPAAGMGSSTDESALGGTARTTMLADETVDALPDQPLAWLAHKSSMPAAAVPITHAHDGPGFVYAAGGAHTVTIGDEDVMLRPGEAVFVGEGVEHTHSGQSIFWDIRLTDPDAGPPTGMDDALRVFASSELEGIPDAPVNLAFILVELPPGSQTSVHTHPGPEYIYMTDGDIEYQNAIVGTLELQEGDDHALAANTAVQKRNPERGKASFLSLFVVDPDEPFATEARFE